MQMTTCSYLSYFDRKYTSKSPVSFCQARSHPFLHLINHSLLKRIFSWTCYAFSTVGASTFTWCYLKAIIWDGSAPQKSILFHIDSNVVFTWSSLSGCALYLALIPISFGHSWAFSLPYSFLPSVQPLLRLYIHLLKVCCIYFFSLFECHFVKVPQ